MRNPFPGLRPFEADEEHLFFGRERETDDLLRRLRATRFIAVIGTSGSGKSSLVRSGLIPALQGGYLVGASSTWRIAVSRPGDQPIAHLAAALAGPGVLEPADADLASAGRVVMEATLRRGPLGLVDAVRQAHLPPGDNLLVLVDQFEELFRYRSSRTASSHDESIAFVRLLLEAAAQRDAPIYVVLTMRSDFIGDCMVFPGLPDAVNAGLYLVGRMSREAMRSAIGGPVAVAGATIAPRLVNRVLNDLGDDHDQLPILQHALMRTWDRWAALGDSSRPLDIDDYEAVGAFNGALFRHAEEAYGEIAAAGLGTLAEHVFRALTDTYTDPRGTRRPTAVADLAAISGGSEADIVRVIDAFRQAGRSFLMPPASVPLTPRSVVDLSHESLMRCWPRLIEWTDKERAAAGFYVRLAQAARWFEDGTAGLWVNPELELGARWVRETRPNAAWAARYDPSFDRAIAFLERSAREHERREMEAERQRRTALRRARAVALTLALLLAVAAVAGYVAWRERTRAEANLDLARQAVDTSLATVDRDPALLGADLPQVQELRRELLGKAEQFYVAFLRQAPSSERLRRDVAFAHLRLGHIDRMLEKRDAAAGEYQEAIARFGSLAAARPRSIEYRAGLADGYNWLGETLRPIADRASDAERAYDQAFAIQQALVREVPGDTELQRALARTHYNRGILRSARPDRAADAEADFREAIRLLTPLAGGDARAAQELARADNNLGALLSADDRRAADTERLWNAAIDIDERLSRADPGNREYRSELATYCANLAAFLSDRGDAAAADRRISEAISLMDELARLAPSLAIARADAHDIRAHLLAANQSAAAEREYAETVDLFLDAARDPALDRLPDFHLRFGDLLLNLATFAGTTRDADREKALLARAVAAYAAVAERIADGGSAADGQLAGDTIARVGPSLSARDRAVLAAAASRLERRGR